MKYEDVTIKQFMNAWFKRDFSELSEKDFEIVHGEYIETTGLYENEVFEKSTYVYYLNNRVNSITLFCSLQRRFLLEFSIPYVPKLNFVENFGHKLEWKEDVEAFLFSLRSIENQEKIYESELEDELIELSDIKKKLEKEEKPTEKQSRESFIRMLNSLGKIGYSIDKSTTTVEELALMMKQQSDENEKMIGKVV